MASKLQCFILLALIGTCFNADTGNKTSTTTPTPITSTSTTPYPTTTLAPVDQHPLLHFNLTITEKNETYICAMFNFVAKVELRKVNSTEVVDIPLLASTEIDLSKSSCDTNVTTLTLNIDGESQQSLEMRFNHNAENTYSLGSISYKSDKNVEFKSNATQFTVDANKAYLCSSSQEIQLSQENDMKGYLILKDFKVDAFRKKEDGTDFKTGVQECEADYPQNDFVPLAVGCALISLVFIVLIAYIVGRKRSRRLTYQSV